MKEIVLCKDCKNLIPIDTTRCICDEFGGYVDEDDFVYELPTPKYCGDCGQALDWSDTDEMPNIKSKE